MKKEWIKLGLAVVIALLFILIIVVIMNFIKTREEDVDLSPEPPIEEEIIFKNASDMNEQEIRLLVEEKRMDLKKFFDEAEFYSIGEVALDYTSEDNEDYIVVDEDFLSRLKELLTDKAYNQYWQEFDEVDPKPDVELPSRIYKAPHDLFDSIYVTSAIPSFDVSEELLILEAASNTYIDAIENIKLCNDQDLCRRNDFYELDLQKEDGIWKIANFTTLRKM